MRREPEDQGTWEEPKETHFHLFPGSDLEAPWDGCKKEITAIPAVMAKIEEGTSKPESFMSSTIQAMTCLFVQYQWRGHTVVSSSWDSKATPSHPELASWKCR